MIKKGVHSIEIEDFNYPLPEDRIARYPAGKRETSRLLISDRQSLTEDNFFHIGRYLPEKALLISNETKVIRARLHFKNQHGALIEVFCLEPEQGNLDGNSLVNASSPVVWKCLVGNSKRWKDGILEQEVPFENGLIRLKAERIEKMNDHSLVSFSWDEPNTKFGQMLEYIGELPLPPYLNRKAGLDDLVRYQTVFARNQGSVAAPTAGLHFTDELVKTLEDDGFKFARLTLHVGAGTFKPVSTETIGNHAMHAERFFVSKQTIQQLLLQQGKPIIPIGTTSMRTIESLYWLGLGLSENENPSSLHVNQWIPYHDENEPNPRLILEKLLEYMHKKHLEVLSATTALMIAPGYDFKIANGLITNFHQPKSTLLLLVAALVGNRWKDAYTYALNNQFRFLSYGDSCLFFP